MNKQNASQIVSELAAKKSKKVLFGLSADELKMVTGGGGVIIESPHALPDAGTTGVSDGTPTKP